MDFTIWEINTFSCSSQGCCCEYVVNMQTGQQLMAAVQSALLGLASE